MFKNIRGLKKTFLLIGILLLTVASTPFFFSPGLEYVSPVDPYLNGKFPTSLSLDLEWANYDATGISGALTARRVPGTNTMAFGRINGTINFYDFDTNTLSDIVWNIAPTGGFVGGNRHGLKGLAFHPEYGELNSPNRNYVYISVLTDEFTRKVSRYTVDEQTGILNANSELVMIELLGPTNSYHSVGELAFGGDGFLYIPFGDGSGNGSDEIIPIIENYVQNIEGNLIGGVLRVDVDEDPTKSHPPIKKLPQTFEGEISGIGYYIPNDNPWLSPTGDTMEEYFTLGHRNPWKLTVDDLTGKVWVSEVGPWNGEEVNLLQNGHNYGWPYRVGSTGSITWDRREPTEPMPNPFLGTLTEPIFSPTRDEASNSYLGAVYRGTKWPEYYGKVMFADISKKNAWMVGYNQETDESSIDELPNVSTGYVFFESPLGDIMTLTTGGTMMVLKPSEANSDDFPELLSETGAFTSLSPLIGSSSLIPYTVNTPLWSDRAEKERWIVLPNDGVFNTSEEQITFKSDAPWEFPEGTVFIKHFALALNENNPDNLTPLETRFMIVGENGGTYGVTYKWLEDGSDAVLTLEGATEDFNITADDGSNYTQTWEYPSSNDCINCHNANAGQSLGINTQQLNGDYKYPLTGITDNQLNTLNELNIFDTDIGEASQYIHNVALDDPTASNELKVRSYLDANCAYCHMPSGVAAAFDARITTPLLNQGLIKELVASAGSENDMVIVPGDLTTSELYLRDNSTGPNAMPPLGRTMVDEDYIKVLEAWVYGLIGENIALNKSTQQSTTAFGGTSLRAVDGNRSGHYTQNSTTHTASNNTNSWWRVDLENTYKLSTIKIFNRTDCCSQRLDQFKVYVSTINSNDPSEYEEIGTLNADFEQSFNTLETIGRYVMIHKESAGTLSLAEVEVYGDLVLKNVTDIIISPNTATIAEGETQQLIATVSPTDADDVSVNWASSDTTIATVDSNGLVTAVLEGIVTITGTTTDGSLSYSSIITIEPEEVTPSDVIVLTAPNPADNKLYAFYYSAETLDITVLNIYDINNNLVKTFSDPGSTLDNDGNYVLVVSDIPVGTYTLEAVSTTGNHNKEIIIARENNVTILTAPNPVNFTLYVYIDSSQLLDITTLNIYDANNDLVKTFSDPGSLLDSDGNYVLVVSDIPVGTYTLEAVSTTGNHNKEIIIARENNVTVLTAPNPADFVLYVYFDSSQQLDITTLNIYDTNNNLVKSFANASSLLDSDGNYVLVVSDIPVGSYTVEGISTTGSYSNEITIARETVSEVIMLVAPNPAIFKIYVYFSSTEPLEIATLNIYDTLGRLIKTFSNPSAILADDGNYVLNIDGIPAGNYIVEGVSVSGNYQKTVIIEN